MIPEFKDILQEPSGKDYVAYDEVPSLEDLVRVARFSTEPFFRQKASKEIIDSYKTLGAYRDLKKIASDSWIDDSCRILAKDSVYTAMLTFYVKRVSGPLFKVADYGVKEVSFNNLKKIVSLEFVAKDQTVDFDDRFKFSKTVFKDWVLDSFYEGLSVVSRNQKSFIDRDYDGRIRSEAIKQLPLASANLFEKMELVSKDDGGLFDTYSYFNVLTDMLFDPLLDPEVNLQYSLRLFNSLTSPKNFLFFDKLLNRIQKEASSIGSQEYSNGYILDILDLTTDKFFALVDSSMVYAINKDACLLVDMLNSSNVPSDTKRILKSYLSSSVRDTVFRLKAEGESLNRLDSYVRSSGYFSSADRRFVKRHLD